MEPELTLSQSGGVDMTNITNATSTILAVSTTGLSDLREATNLLHVAEVAYAAVVDTTFLPTLQNRC
jgi:hypothetical protein